MKRIGIYSGSFDPVHAGHLSFALQAMQNARLDKLYFLPERRPRNKPGVEHFAHRVAMLKRAAKPYGKFGVLEIEDVSFSVNHTLPRLKKKFPGARLVFLFGSDVAASLPDWPHADSLLETSELVVGVRAADDCRLVEQRIAAWPTQPRALHVFESFAADVSSGQVRAALRARQPSRGLLASVVRYANNNWLYISLSQQIRR